MKKSLLRFIFIIFLQTNAVILQDINTLIKENSKLKKTTKKFEEKIKKFSAYEKYKNSEKANLEKELKIVSGDYDEEVTRFKLFGMFTEETGLKYLNDLRQSLENTHDPKLISELKKEYSNSFEVIRNNAETHILSIDKLIENINKLDKQDKSIFYNQLIYLIRQSNYLEKADKDLENKLTFFENERKKTNLSSQFIQGKIKLDSQNVRIIEPKCVNRDSCRVCLEDPSCVWCNLDRKCNLGDESGPIDGSCVKSFNYSYCEKSCLQLSSCSSCIQNSLCGWCGSLSKCIEGNSQRPIGIMCESGYFHKQAQGRCSNHFLNNEFRR